MRDDRCWENKLDGRKGSEKTFPCWGKGLSKTFVKHDILNISKMSSNNNMSMDRVK